MSKFFYAKLALSNMNKNRKTYIPYLLTCIGTIAMFYILHHIAVNEGLSRMSGGNSLRAILFFGSIIIGVFSFIFLFYTNSFLIKRRKKEFGLFNILGMEKKHISKIMLWESIYSAIISLSIGLISGIILSKLMFLLLEKLLKFQVPFQYFISVQSLWITTILFIGIFTVSLLNNLRHIHLTKPIELLKGSQVGEKEPKTKWVLVLIGIITLSIGYYIALVTESPLAALNKFFIAVLLVIIGTYSLFTAGTIAFLKLLRKNKTLYYKTKNFINVSGMIYRMKQNAVGLANICILSTAVLVTLSTTVSLYIGMEDLLKNRYPKEISVNADNITYEQMQSIQEMITENAKEHNVTMKDITYYRYVTFPVETDNQTFATKDTESFSDLSLMTLIPLSDYNEMENRNVTLNDHEVLLYQFRGEDVEKTLNLDGKTFTIKEQLEDLTVDGMMAAITADSYFIVVKDEKTALDLYPAKILNDSDTTNLSLYFGFNTEGEAKNDITLTNALTKGLTDLGISGYAEGAEHSRESFFSLYGGLFFIGIFIGALFIMATVLIIYYKQISEGYDDKERFEIMQKVGLSKLEIKNSIKSQVLMVFFLPLLTAVVHIAFAFKVITKLLALFNMTNVGLFTICTAATILVFALFYAMVYVLTAREYYKIVS